MTDAASAQTPADEQKRKVIEDAIMAFRPGVIRDFPRDPPAPVQPGQALATLATDRTVRRLTKHRRLIDGLRRIAADNSIDSTGVDDAARLVLTNTLEQDLPDDQRQQLADRAKQRLDEVVADEGEGQLQRQHWQHWVHSTDDIYRFTTHERTLAACNDEQLVWKLTPDGQSVLSRLIVAQFWSDLPAAAFRDYVQPKYWPKYCTFWESVTALPPDGQEVPVADGYDWDFEEKVNVISRTLAVPLQSGFRELPDQSRVWTRFNLSKDYYALTTPVDVDTGIVSAESVPNGPARTLVKATKYVHWRDNNQPDLTAQACDFGWCELMVEMAHAAAQGMQGMTSPRPQVSRPGAGTARSPAKGAARQFAEAVTTECQQVIGDNGPHLEKLIKRFTGKSWDAGWINDLLDMGLTTARHYGNLATDVRRLADSLGNTQADEDAAAAAAAAVAAAAVTPANPPAPGNAPAAGEAPPAGDAPPADGKPADKPPTEGIGHDG